MEGDKTLRLSKTFAVKDSFCESNSINSDSRFTSVTYKTEIL